MRYVLLLIFLITAGRSGAQEAFYETAKIPLDSTINIALTARDTVSLDYYSLYTFQYRASGSVVQAQFLVPKHLDSYRAKKQATVKLCRLTSFINSWQGTEGNPIAVEDFVDVMGLYGKGKIHLNLDPEMPDPVFTIYGTQKGIPNKK